MHSFSDVFERVKEVCRGEMSEVAYNLWIDKLELTDMDSSTARLICSTEFMREIINEKYNALLTAAFEQTMGFPVKVEILSQETAAVRQPPAPPKKTEFIPEKEYSFETFVVGSGNSLAHAAAWAVANNPAKSYNPLFLHGGSGLGKTHLMHAIGHELLKNFPNMRLLCITSEDFVNEFIQCIQDKNTESFRRRYRNVDVLFVDDIQFLGRGDKESSKEEFFHTFNKLYQDKKQMVFTSDRPPRDIKKLEERLRSRFENGMVTQIEPPDLETRTAILRAWAEKENITCDLDALNYIAANVSENIRKLHGAFIRVLLEASQSKSNVTLPLVKHAIHYITDAQDEKKYITIDEITTYICQHYNINYKELMGKKKTKDIALPRQIAMYMCRELTGNTYPHIGTAFNGRDHTTVMHACSQIRKKIDKDSHFKEHLEKMMNEIRGVDN